MTHSPADVIRWLLVALGQGTDPTLSPLQAWPIYCQGEPNEPDNCVTTYDTQGVSDGRSMNDGELWQHWGIQVRVRAKDHPTGTLKATAIRTAMAQSVNLSTVSREGKTYLVWCVARISPVIWINRDKPRSERSIFTINATTTIRPTN